MGGPRVSIVKYNCIDWTSLISPRTASSDQADVQNSVFHPPEYFPMCIFEIEYINYQLRRGFAAAAHLYLSAVGGTRHPLRSRVNPPSPCLPAGYGLGTRLYGGTNQVQVTASRGRGWPSRGSTASPPSGSAWGGVGWGGRGGEGQNYGSFLTTNIHA